MITVQDTVFDGYTSDIVVTVSLSNPNTLVSGLQFDIEDIPDLLFAVDVVAVERATGFVASFTNLDNAHLRVVLVSTTGSTITAGDGPILEVHYDGGDIPSAVIDLFIMKLVFSDLDGGEIEAVGENGTLKIGPTASLIVIGGTADAAESVDIFVSLTNDAGVGGLQFDLFDNPNLIDIDFVSYQFWDQVENKILTLISLGQFAVGTPEALFLIEEGAGNAGGSGYYEVELENSVDVFGFQLFIEDFPDWLTVVDVEKTGRIPADAPLSWNEFTDGTLRILEFDMNPPIEAIIPGSGPILVVRVEVIPSALEGEIELKFTQTSASDEAGDPTIFSFGMGGLFDIGTTGISDESRKIIPEYFALHRNYPNPFNPVTTIAHDLPEAGDITVTIPEYTWSGSYNVSEWIPASRYLPGDLGWTG